MVRPEEKKVLKAMKEAKTAVEMTKSWAAQRPGYDRSAGLEFYEQRKPEMVFTYAHNQLTQMIERGILDPKTRYLVIIACYMMAGHWEGLLPQCCNAKAAGATEEEIMEVAFLVCYTAAKGKNVDTSQVLSRIFDNPTFKKIHKLEE